MLKSLFEWSKRNLTYVFSVLGIALTIYFSVFYVPGYIREARQERSARMNTELLEDVQAIVYAGVTIDTSWIRTLIRGKEMRYGQVFPYTVQELLIQVQEQFISNKFIPLEQRQILFLRVDSLRRVVPMHAAASKSRGTPWLFWLDVLPALLGLVLSAFGAISVTYFRRRQRLQDIEAEVGHQASEIGAAVQRGVQFADAVEGILRRNAGDNAVIRILDPDLGVDFIVETPRGLVGVVANSQADPVQVGRIRRLKDYRRDFEAADLLILSDTRIMDVEKEQFRRVIGSGTNVHFVEAQDGRALEAAVLAILRRLSVHE